MCVGSITEPVAAGAAGLAHAGEYLRASRTHGIVVAVGAAQLTFHARTSQANLISAVYLVMARRLSRHRRRPPDRGSTSECFLSIRSMPWI